MQQGCASFGFLGAETVETRTSQVCIFFRSSIINDSLHKIFVGNTNIQFSDSKCVIFIEILSYILPKNQHPTVGFFSEFFDHGFLPKDSISVAPKNLSAWQGLAPNSPPESGECPRDSVHHHLAENLQKPGFGFLSGKETRIQNDSKSA